MRFTLIAAVVTISATASATPTQDLNDGRTAFKAKEFAVARRILADLIYPQPKLGRTDDLVEAYVMGAACLVELGRTDEAKAEFKSALQLQPERRLVEGGYYSEATIRVFEAVRAELLESNKRLDEARLRQEQLDQIENLKKTIVLYEDHPWSRNFVPFGAGQFQNKRPVRGILFASGQAATLVTSVGIYAYLVNTYGLNNSHVPLADGPTVRRLQIDEIVTGAAFIGLYGWGVIDALLNYQPRVRGEFDETLLTPEQRKLLESTKKKTPQTSLRIGPMITPSGVGIGLSWEN
ncbi:MAG: hypothetical protein NT062_36240 [Proteobacteria bacterium]|nr:hypothetical protein [Pseudomonadota bacterium]